MVTLEQRADDIGAVMNAAGSSRAAFIGWADGGAIGAMFAATHPDRISALMPSAMSIAASAAAVRADPTVMQQLWNTIEQGWAAQPDRTCGASARRRSPLANLLAPPALLLAVSRIT
jgi:pimeloyl-ACP methyl ester carboxylesterase